MRPPKRRFAASCCAFLSILAAPACIEDTVPPDIYASESQPQRKDAAVAAVDAHPSGSGSETGPGPNPGLDAGSSTQPEPVVGKDGGASSPLPQTGGSAGACDLSGHWLITQHTIAQGLGVKQRGAWWFYYQLEQNGSDLTVKKGLVCGSEVYPVDLLAAGVEFSASFPDIVRKNSNAGRRGKATASGSNCSVSFERSYDIVGASTPYYKDPSKQLPTLDQKASGSTPGWEDWDSDGHPAVSLNVSGIATGQRYTVLRLFSEWSGTITAGATNFKLAVPVWGQEEAVLGVTSDLLKLTGVPDPEASGHFTQFAKLTADQVQGDDLAVCDTVRKLAPMLTAEANK